MGVFERKVRQFLDDLSEAGEKGLVLTAVNARLQTGRARRDAVLETLERSGAIRRSRGRRGVRYFAAPRAASFDSIVLDAVRAATDAAARSHAEEDRYAALIDGLLRPTA